MAVSQDVTLDGVEELLANIGRFEVELRLEIRALILKYVFKIERSAKKNLDRAGKPGVDEGRLRSSIHGMLELIGLSGRVETNLDYAIYVHEGTGMQGPNKSPRKPPPIAPLKEWAKRHGMDEGAAYAIQKLIAVRGTAPNPFMIDAYNEHINDFVRDLTTLIGEKTK